MRKAPSIELTDDQRHALAKLANGRRTEVRVAMRAKVVLAAARGQENRAIAEDLNINRETVARWRSRVAERGVDSIMKDLPRGGRKPSTRKPPVDPSGCRRARRQDPAA